MVDRHREIMTPGSCVATPAAIEALKRVGVDVASLIHRHVGGDWGKHGTFDETALTERERQFGAMATSDDGKLNRLAVERGDGSRVMSEYTFDDGTRIWVSTEGAGGDRATTVFLPEEY